MRGDFAMREYNVHEVLAILQKYYVTDSQQMVARWIREGKIQGIRSENRKEGYRVSEEDLFDFIEEQCPGLPSIMEGYEAYVKQLNPEYYEETKHSLQIEEIQDQMNDPKDIENDKVINDLRKQVNNLENALIDLQQENQIIEMKTIEIVEQMNTLKEENTALHEENTTLIELYEMIEEEKKQLIKQTATNDRGKDSKKIESPTKEKNNPLTFENFTIRSKEVVSKLNSEMEDMEIENHLRNIYDQIFENGLIKPDLIAEDGSIACPFTKKGYRQKKRLINNAIQHYFENFNEQKLNQVQSELTMANE